MAEFTDAHLNDENHWRVDLRGTIDGQETLRSYHLAAGSRSEARVEALRRFSGPWDEVPLVAHDERYRTWRAYESQPEGRMGEGWN